MRMKDKNEDEDENENEHENEDEHEIEDGDGDVRFFGDRYDIVVAAVARTSRSFLQAVQRCSAAVPVRAVPTPSMTLTRGLPW